MLDWFRLFAEIQDARHVADIHDLDDEFTAGRQSHGSSASGKDTYSLATATHALSGDRARSRIGREQRTSIFSKEFVSNEYNDTEPSSEPLMKKSFYTMNKYASAWLC